MEVTFQRCYPVSCLDTMFFLVVIVKEETFHSIDYWMLICNHSGYEPVIHHIKHMLQTSLFSIVIH
jgi:hypothetical protein